MLRLARPLQLRIYSSHSARRWASTSATSSASPRPRWRAPALLLLGLGGGATYTFSRPIRADDEGGLQSQTTMTTASLGSLIRTYVVYSMCSVPALVDMAPSLLHFFTSIPVIKNVTEAVVRVTFFDQFVGGDTAQETVPLLRALRQVNKGALFAYSIEVDEHEATAHSAEEEERSGAQTNYVAADFEDEILRGAQTGRRTWVAVKMTALLPDAHTLLIHEPRYPVPFPGCPRASDLEVLYDKRQRIPEPLTNEDIEDLRELHSDLRRICTRASERGVKIILDAEYSWYQPAIDALQLSLMREFNAKKSKEGPGLNIQPLIYGIPPKNAFQLQYALKDAQESGYTLGVKLVRGAYHPHEVAACQDRKLGKPSLSISPEDHPPVWSAKEETDKCYNECTKTLIGWIKVTFKDQSAERNRV
ncbi:hypothetical protein VNI00_012187 [Paramarasmius palmivorus]|uniref:Proline dehydrogenase n=1 Tax=Paramarasmius palmivorus TaxID=297713 RepID=A0AAW0CAA7_9AGAR